MIDDGVRLFWLALIASVIALLVTFAVSGYRTSQALKEVIHDEQDDRNEFSELAMYREFTMVADNDYIWTTTRDKASEWAFRYTRKEDIRLPTTTLQYPWTKTDLFNLLPTVPLTVRSHYVTGPNNTFIRVVTIGW